MIFQDDQEMETTEETTKEGGAEGEMTEGGDAEGETTKEGGDDSAM